MPLEPIGDHVEFLAAAENAEWKPKDVFKRAKLEDIFERAAPLEVDLGCGEGAFMLAMSKRYPERNFLGTERMLKRVEKVCRLIGRARLTNARVLRLESAFVVDHLLPRESVAVAHVAFPDPWPKRNHQPRRLVQDAFLVAVHGMLAPGGELRIKTDDLPYFQWIEKVLARAKGFERIEWAEDPEYPITNFERHFIAQGLPIHRARMRKL
jgi:tRNA (guanine-N7-)-methyltransferase